MSASTSRRRFLQVSSATIAASTAHGQNAPLNRKAIVARHNPVVHSFDPRSSLSVGNGEFAFTADATGLQTFPEPYEKEIPLCTQSQWGWHTAPGNVSPADLKLQQYDAHGRDVGYATNAKGQEKTFNWLRENPHRLHLGRIALALRRTDGSPATLADITGVNQVLELWTGILDSRFEFDGEQVHVRTCCHPQRDCVAVEVESSLAAGGRLALFVDFPYGSPQINAADWNSPSRHRTVMVAGKAGIAELRRELDGDRYFVRIASGDAVSSQPQPHRIELEPRGNTLRATFEFSPRPIPSPVLAARLVLQDIRKKSAHILQGGAAVDFSGSRDGRAPELERRVVLSQYLTAIQCAGSMPPQETGLTCNSWYGKFHLEMHWWHAAHFPLWGRTALLERSLGWYKTVLPQARSLAKQQGYSGCRWPKMVGPEGRDSPSSIGPLLIWQQPHPIVLAELCYRSHPDRETLQRHRDIVLESAEFMASYAFFDAARGRYVLGPPVIPAQENHPPRETWNPTFELAYWKHGLEVAQRWRERLGLNPEPKWREVIAKLAAYPAKDGVYLAHENCPQTFTGRNRDHPSMLGAFGVLRGDGIDREVMRNTLRKVLRDWRWEDTWGWDFPMVAMTAARLGEAQIAVDALFLQSPKNVWLPNGHNYQRANLCLYLPGNGGLLTAIAMMAAGWTGDARSSPGFPKDTWTVRAEGLRPLMD